MQFVVNNKRIEVDAEAADMTLLNYLRMSAQMTGTKEGCASGDCGACTVLVGRPDVAAGMVYREENACICPLGSLQGCTVITVEGLAGSADELHPVQAAMVECHASQCGFCTPGFVMALTGLHLARGAELAQADIAVQRAAVLEAISGNLCRCTGYRPIVEAGLSSLKKPAHVASFVQEWQPNEPLAGTVGVADVGANKILSKNGSAFWQPTSEPELQALLMEYPQARLVAGGTDLMLEVTQQYKSLPQLIDVSQIASLSAIDGTGDDIVLGAAATYTQLEKSLRSLAPEFVALLGRVGSRQIRNRGTLGGNIANASPIADTPPYFLVVDAELEIGNAQGEYRRESITQFYRDYKKTTLAAGEYLARIYIKREQLQRPIKLFKISKRYEDDISAVMGAFCWSGAATNEWRIAFGGMAGIPKRASATEQFLSSNQWYDAGAVNEALLAQACELLRGEFAPMTDVRASAAYRMAMACNLLKKACYELAAEASGAVVEERLYQHA